MNLFTQDLEKIKKIAEKISFQYNNHFEVDELVNAAYIGFRNAISLNPDLLFAERFKMLYRAKKDILEYIRKELKNRKKYNIKFFNVSSLQSDETILQAEPLCKENGYSKVEDSDFLNVLFEKSQLSSTDWAIIQGYFYDERMLKTIGEDIGLSESRICNRKKEICNRLKEVALQLR